MSTDNAAFSAGLAEIREVLGDQITTNSSVREHHSHDESWHDACLPAAVCFVNTAEQVSHVLSACNRHQIPVTPFGAGTGMEGAAIPTEDSIVLDLSGMNEILQVNAEDLDCTIQPGVTRDQLNQHLRDTGLFFPVDPGADASLGGMAATRASGTTTVRYGTMRDNVLSLTVVLADGRIVKTSQRAKKSAAGYDLTRLFIGSEGTLGVIVELTLRLYGRPEAVSAARVQFPDIDSAVETAIQTIQCGIPIARIELIDANMIAGINSYSNTSFAVKPTLFLEFHGGEQSVAEQTLAFGEIATDLGGAEFEWTVHEEERSAMWEARHKAAYATKAMRPNASAYATDICVPISKLAECIRETQADIDAHCDLQTFIVGHIGDGNFHCAFLVDRDNSDEYAQVKALCDRLVTRALEMGGTCTGEHGIGRGKRAFLAAELGPEAIELMRTIKTAIDPHNILNPGKILPDEAS